MWKSVLGTSCVLAGSFIFQQQLRTVNAEEPTFLDYRKPSLENSIEKANAVAIGFKESVGSPGLAVGVIYHGNTIWQRAYGYSDVENCIPMSVNSVVRIASISKSISSLLALRLIDTEKLDVNYSVKDLVPEFPDKFVDGVKADIRVHHILSHTSGIRHYKKKSDNDEDGTDKENHREFQMKEYYIADHFDSVIDSLNLFKNDELYHLPGKGFTYTSHGYTLVAAVIERAAKVKFETQLNQLFSRLNMLHTHLENNEAITPCRARHYVREKDGRLKNVRYVDNSYKWAGGGITSNIPDLLKFSKHVMDISAGRGPKENQIVSRQSLQMAWTPVPNTEINWFGKASGLKGAYGFGWAMTTANNQNYVLHTGGAVGATSVLLLVPEHELGVVILTNVQDASGIALTGKKIADAFLESLSID